MPQRAYGTHDIARLCHVTPPTVGRWIEDGKIPSFSTAGGHRRVWDTDLAAFLRALGMPVPAELQDSGPAKVLIVDDEVSVRRFLKRALKHVFGEEVTVLEAEDGFGAGHAVTAERPGLVILDVQLPGARGDAVCRVIRQDEQLKGVKILAISGVNVDETRRKMLEAGADDFLGKPFTIDELGARLTRLLPHVPAVERA
jgi:excisionase family DNA binding protein